jgi:hypothetical protein
VPQRLTFHVEEETMISEENQRIAAREILIVAGLLLLALALQMCIGFDGCPFWSTVTNLYMARWVCWALTKSDRNTFRQSGLLLVFAAGAALAVGSVLSVGTLVATLQHQHEPQPVRLAAAFVLVRSIGAAVGILLMRWALRRQSPKRQTDS